MTKMTLEVPGNAPDARHIYTNLGFKVVKEATEEESKIDLMFGGLTTMEYRFANTQEVKMGDLDTLGAYATESVLAHYGVKGMRWGVTTKDRASQKSPTPVEIDQSRPGKFVKTSGGKNQPAHPDALSALEARQKAQSSTTDSLSNKELQSAVNRMQLEKRYAELTFANDRRSRGARFVSGLFNQKRYDGKDLKFEDGDEKQGEMVRNTIENYLKMKRGDESDS